MSTLYDAYQNAVRGKRLPLLLLDVKMLETNAAYLCAAAGSKPIRIATKSVRSPEILRKLLSSYPSLKGLMSYSAGEAAFLAAEGFDDILIGYPTVDESDLRLALAHVKAGKKIVFMVCSREQLIALAKCADAAGTTASVCLDLDQALPLPGLYFGVRRSSLRGADRVVRFLSEVQKLKHVKFVGFMGYDAQIAGVQDQHADFDPQDLAVRYLKKLSASRLRREREDISRAVKAAGYSIELFNVGGTGSLDVFRDDSCVTELTAGSGFYGPRLFDHYRNLKLQPALTFAIPVTRKSNGKWITCHGGGYTASGQAGKDRLPQPYLPQGLSLTRHEGAGEVQTPIVGDIQNINIGDPIFFRHAKAAEVCEHFNDIHLLENGRIVGSVKTYRGHGQAFL